jgi:hypothetical protein
VPGQTRSATLGTRTRTGRHTTAAPYLRRTHARAATDAHTRTRGRQRQRGPPLGFSSAVLAARRPHAVMLLSGAIHMANQQDLLLELDFFGRALAVQD